MSAAPETPDERIERLLRDVERADDDAGRERARALVDAVLAWHGQAIARVLELGGAELLEKIGRDPLAAALLELHGLAGPAPSVTVDRLRSSAAAIARPQVDTCETCGASLAEGHDHVYDVDAGSVRCACVACAVASPHPRVRPLVEALGPPPWSDAQWEQLGIPIGLAFFQRSSRTDDVRVFYPSPAGAVEAVPPSEGWAGALGGHGTVAALAQDVEALLVRRLGSARATYRVSIDHAYALVARIRRGWRGLGGGAEMWRDVDAFFERLDRGGGAHA